MMLAALRWGLVLLGLLMAGGTLLSLARSSHWGVRGWDFPRMQIAGLAAASGVGYAALFFSGGAGEWAFLGGMAATVLWQGTKIWPYTPLAPVQVLPSRTRRPGSRAGGTLRLLISNLLMENRQHHRFLSLVRRHDPDLVLALEVSTEWMEALEPLAEAYPHAIRYPQDNYYGMALFSRLPLREAEVRFLVQEDIPSIRATFELPGGVPVRLYGLHPRPPEPIRRQSSAPRDAELVRVGHEIRAAESHPAIVAGDLNDVAWSPVSELFLRLSGLLDPRRGRGFFNSFDANNPFFRFPLDHVFHSNHFKLVDLRRLEKIGSDHFPIYVELSYEPAAEREQPRTALEPGDEEVAREKLDEEREEAATGRDLPQRDG